jgi:hypothetical protein
MKPVEEVLGTVGFATMTVRPGDTALAMGLSELPVVATSHLLHIMGNTRFMVTEQARWQEPMALIQEFILKELPLQI